MLIHYLGAVARGGFREDLLARINLWTFALPPLRERPEDLEPNLRYELEEFRRKNGLNVTFNREAREHFLRFATGPDAAWAGNFRDLNAAVTRMATLATAGRITVGEVDDELSRLRNQWAMCSPDAGAAGGGPADGESLLAEHLSEHVLDGLDPFDRVQLAEVIRVCRTARSLSDAGRVLFAASRVQKAKPNDADRLRKYLARFGLEWRQLSGAER